MSQENLRYLNQKSTRFEDSCTKGEDSDVWRKGIVTILSDITQIPLNFSHIHKQSCSQGLSVLCDWLLIKLFLVRVTSMRNSGYSTSCDF